jgi:hypothetical protein
LTRVTVGLVIVDLRIEGVAIDEDESPAVVDKPLQIVVFLLRNILVVEKKKSLEQVLAVSTKDDAVVDMHVAQKGEL